jgi:hypothetical protein
MKWKSWTFSQRKLAPGIEARYAMAMEGRRLSEIVQPSVFVRALEFFKVVLLGGQPIYTDLVNAAFNKPFEDFERLVVPLFDEGGRPVAFFALIEWRLQD